jgi:hypothetical protein
MNLKEIDGKNYCILCPTKKGLTFSSIIIELPTRTPISLSNIELMNSQKFIETNLKFKFSESL